MRKPDHDVEGVPGHWTLATMAVVVFFSTAGLASGIDAFLARDNQLAVFEARTALSELLLAALLFLAWGKIDRLLIRIKALKAARGVAPGRVIAAAYGSCALDEVRKTYRMLPYYKGGPVAHPTSGRYSNGA